MIRGLAERHEERVLFLLGNAHAIVLDLERHRASSPVAFDNADGKLHERVATSDVGAVLDGVVEEVDATLSQSEKITDETRVEAIRVTHGDDEVHAATRRLLGHVRDLFDELPDGEDVRRELDAAAAAVLGAFKFGEIQNLVDEAEERLGGGETRLDETAGELGELARLHRERVETDDGVERRAKLVRDVEEEGALRAAHLNAARSRFSSRRSRKRSRPAESISVYESFVSTSLYR